MGKSCPFTSGKATVGYTNGEIVEKDPTKNDNVYYLDEPLAYTLTYNDNKKHIKRPVKGSNVTIYNPDKKSIIAVTDSTGTVDIPLDKIGKYYVSYYDAAQSRVVTVGFNVVPPKGNTIPIVNPIVTPNPINSTKPSPAPVDPLKGDFTIETGSSTPKPKNPLKSMLQAFLSLFKRKQDGK